MALPWLIGAAVLGVGAWIASSSSDESSNSNGGDDEERRRRERAEQNVATANNKSYATASKRLSVRKGNSVPTILSNCCQAG